MTNPGLPDLATRRVLQFLASRQAWLVGNEPAAGRRSAGKPVTYRLARDSGPVHEIDIAAEVVEAATAKGWLAADEGRVTLTATGARLLHLAQAGTLPSPPAARAKPTASVALPATARGAFGRRRPTERIPGFNPLESPLGWLRRRKDKDGKPILSEAQFAAGERLRADVFFAGLTPHVTGAWSPTAGINNGKRGTPGASVQMLDQMVSARQRVDRAMRAVGPELSGVLLDVCAFLKGLEEVEMERCWPPRSGKVVLLLALSRLAAHYGLESLLHGEVDDRPPRRRRIRQWGASDYRPDLSQWQDADQPANGDDQPQVSTPPTRH